MKALIQSLPQPAESQNITALASVRTERFVPSNTVTTLTLGNQAIADHVHVYKNGLRLDAGGAAAYSVSGKVVTLTVAANGTDIYVVDYFFRAS